MEQTTLENETGKRSTGLECVWMLVIKFDYSCVMHAVWILVAEWGGVLSFSMVTVENLHVPDKPAGISLSKYTMLRQKKKRKKKQKNSWSRWGRRHSLFSHIWTSVHTLIIYKPAHIVFLTLSLFAWPVLTLQYIHTLWTYCNQLFSPPCSTH